MVFEHINENERTSFMFISGAMFISVLLSPVQIWLFLQFYANVFCEVKREIPVFY